MKSDRIDNYCKFLEIHKQVYCDKLKPYQYNSEYCETLTSLYLDCIAKKITSDK